MGTTAGPRIDDRLRRFIGGSPEHAAEVTRRAGALAWELGLPRPSYQQVRVLLNASRGGAVPSRQPHAPRTRRPVVELPPRARHPAVPRTGRPVVELPTRARRPALPGTGRRAVELPLRAGRLDAQRTGRQVVDLVLRAGGLVAPRSARAVDVPPPARRPVVPRTRFEVLELIDRLWEYPAPGLSGFYERYKHGRL